MTFIIRVATKEDLETLLIMGAELSKKEQQYEPLLKFSEAEAKERYQTELKNPTSLFLIAEKTHAPVGYLYAHAELVEYLDTNKKECEIEVIFINENYRGNGISTMLIEKCLAWAKTNNIFRVKCGIYNQNTSSQKAFQKFGFAPYHTTYTLPLV